MKRFWIIFILSFFLLAFASTGPQRVWGRSQLARSATPVAVDIPILTYHKIGPSTATNYWVTPELFARQMDVLKAYGYQTVSLQDFISYRAGTAEPPQRPVIITFDDGYQNNFTDARPILKDRDMTATFFIITGKVAETEAGRISNSWTPEEPLAYHMIWPEIQSLFQEGFEIGSHTVTHPDLLGLLPTEVTTELNQSRSDLLSHLPGDALVNTFAYPYGSGAQDDSIRSLVEQAGYVAAVGFGDSDGIANPATSDIWALPRRSILRDNTLDLNPKDPWWFFMLRVDPDFPIPYIIQNQNSFSVKDRKGNERSQVFPGEAITVSVKAQNKGSEVNVLGSLELSKSGVVLYNSHDRNPDQDVAIRPFKSYPAVEVFSYPLTVPVTATEGVYSYTFTVFDEYRLLGYYASGSTTTLSVAPIPISVTTNVNLLSLTGNEEQVITFTVQNTGSPAGQMYLTVSISPHLMVTRTWTTPNGHWVPFPVGSPVKIKDCTIGCPKTSFVIYELNDPAFGTGAKTYALAIKSLPGASADEWLKFRLSMKVPGSDYNGDSTFHDPLVGEPDQQGWEALVIPVLTFRHDIYTPILFH